MSVTAGPGANGAWVTYSQPAVAGGTSPSAPTCDQMSDAPFGFGTHLVTCTVTDAASSIAICSFNVQVDPRKS